MLKKIALTNVGPIPNFDIELGERLNVITGDNGLGKSFILDIIWFILTRSWPASVNKRLTSGYMAKPCEQGKDAEIKYELIPESKTPIQKTITFDLGQQNWRIPQARPPIPGVVIYAHVDGSFSVWDPNKNYWTHKKALLEELDMPAAFVFSPQDVWYGLSNADESVRYCNGLLQDLYDWQKDADWKIAIFNELLLKLSPPDAPLTLGTPIKLSKNDARKVPTIHMPYGDVSILIAAAGIKRILALAYFLAWTLVEHKENSQLIGKNVTSQINFIMDEIEAHLHPKWQRKIIRCLLDSWDNQEINKIIGATPKVQMILATHSPLIMSSLEPVFNPNTDKWFDINMENHVVEITDETFKKYGDVDTWLQSNAFDLTSSRSSDAENAMNDAKALLKKETFGPDEGKDVYQTLLNALEPTDAFLLRFRYLCEKKGITIK